VPLVSPVELRGQPPAFGAVPLHVGVQQVQGDAAHGELPDAGGDGAGARLDPDEDRLTLRPDRQFQRQLIQVHGHGLFPLPAFHVQALQEIALVIEQADAHQGHVQVRGAFDMVPRQHA